ncbi:hypothetical protein ILUMI_11189, partial [Ignelater luminosus]
MEDQDILMDDVDIYVNSVIQHVSAEMFSEDVIRKEQAEDSVIQTVIRGVHSSWKKERQNINATEYFKHRDDLKTTNGILMYRDRIPLTTTVAIQDYYSKYTDIRKLQKTANQAIVEYCKDVMSHHGIPTELRSDNGKQFDSQEFRRFAKEYGQQSNGLAESAVKLVKRILHMNKDPYIAFLAYRNTPLRCGASPAQLLFGRTLRERVPVTKNKLSPKLPNHKEIREKMVQEQQRQKNHYDQRHGVKDNTQLGKGDR